MLTKETVASPNENTYFVFAIVFSVLVWIGLTLFTFGIIWVILAVLAYLAWLANGLIVAAIRSNAVEVHADQLGRLDATFRDVCYMLGQSKVPDLYIIESGGLLNAFAMRHAGRHFVVVYSDMLDALGSESREMRFLLGHEIGHIRQSHLFKRILLAPALFLPLLGPAYLRACESTCDRYGAFAAGDAEAAMRAMMTLAGGKTVCREMSPHHFADQNHKHRGFFVSWYELISGYPTLSRRVRDLRELATGKPEPVPSRNPIAYLAAMVTFGGGLGAALLFGFILCVLAIPAASHAVSRAHSSQEEQGADPQYAPAAQSPSGAASSSQPGASDEDNSTPQPSDSTDSN
jgi:Zn-dependent protease with chaperone function